jgi:hypothetical protein
MEIPLYVAAQIPVEGLPSPFQPSAVGGIQDEVRGGDAAQRGLSAFVSAAAVIKRKAGHIKADFAVVIDEAQKNPLAVPRKDVHSA